ncbi:hypothetical protein CEK25_001578 [Fusarium fujikuroi]|nr:hypothetical protein CEK25_001578 [Fusarium fujikuroi]
MSSSEAKIESYPLASIKSWQRGLPVVCDKGESKEFVLRLTVDGDGLNKIEKLESWPEYSQVRSNAFAYLFVLPSQAEDSHIDFKFGRAFLRKSLRFGFGEFWDTPTPLKNGLSMFATPFNRYGAVRFRTVDLCNITGLTFFYFRGYMMGIHAHTADSPTATSTLDEISAIDPKYLIWAYVPISSKDSLVRIGVRDSLDLCLLPAFKKPTVLISTKLAGDFVLGPDYKYAMKEYLSAKDPSVFVYNVPYNRYHSMYGAVNDNKGDEPLAPFPRTYATGGCPPYRGRIYSQAPAKDIVHVDVYYEEATGYCRGLLLEYANGAQMALGQCRVGIDPFKSFDKPNWLCYAYSSNGKTFNRIGQCKIECSTGSDTHDHDQSEALGIPQLATLPSEVLQLIAAYSRGSLVWRYPTIKARAEELSRFDESSSDDDDMLYNLGTVKKWRRGQDAEFDENPSESFVFRLTLDSHGLLDIERLPDWPEYRSCRYQTYKYFFIDSDEAERTWIYFRFGHARMKLSPSLSRPVQLWDIPSPPSPRTKGLEVLLFPRRVDATCIRTLDLRNITGITFFYYRGTLMGLHAHTLEDPTALTTVRDILSDYEPYLVWIYMPIAHGDRIMRFGLRTWRNDREEPANHHMALLMTTKLAGDFSLGPNFNEEDMNYIFQGTPAVLFHNTPAKGGITLLGLAGGKTQERLRAPRFPIIALSIDQLINGGDAITVDISLKNAVRIDIFTERSTGYLRGFILEYENGAQSRDMSDHSSPDAPQSPRDLSYDPDRYDWEDFARAGDDWEDQDRHICLHDQCDLCLLDMAPDDLAIAVTCETHLRPSYCTKLFRFPAGKEEFQPDGERWILCWDAKCNQSSEVVTMHASCYQLFFQHYTHDNPLKVSPSIAESLGIPQLAQLPPSLVQDIRSMSPDSQVWAYLAIKDRAEGISSAAGRDDLSCMLDKVESWTRDEGAPVMSDSFAGDWSFRVSIDRRGIRNIERIFGISSYAGWRSESLAFALIPPDQAMRSCVDFRLGAARLDLWGGRSVLWDTPSPPLGGKVSWFTASGPSQLSNVRLRMLDLRSTRGLTFFYAGSSLRAIHSHTPRFPTALTTYARLPEHDRKHVVWAHVPISPNDRVIGLGIRTSGTKGGFASPSVLIRTELAGDIVIGPQPKPVHHDLPLVLIKDYSCDIIPEFFAYSLPDINGEYMLLAVAGESCEPNAESTRRFPPRTLSTITHS